MVSENQREVIKWAAVISLLLFAPRVVEFISTMVIVILMGAIVLGPVLYIPYYLLTGWNDNS